MAFVDSLFPTSSLRLIHGFQKSIANPTTIVGNAASEYRIKRLKHYRTQWRYPARLLSSADRKVLANFLTDTAEFGLKSFKFKDPDNNQWLDTPLAHVNDHKFALTVRGAGDSHPIFHYGGDVVVKHNGTPVSATKSVVDGVPVITVPGATSNVTISGTFYYAARFAQDELGWSLEVLDTNNNPAGDNLGDIALIEVFEY